MLGFLEAYNGGVGCFGCGFIFAGGFAKLLGGLSDIKDVINHLKGEADVVAKISQRLKLFGVQLALMPPSRAEQVRRALVLRS